MLNHFVVLVVVLVFVVVAVVVVVMVAAVGAVVVVVEEGRGGIRVVIPCSLSALNYISASILCTFAPFMDLFIGLVVKGSA